MAFAVEDYFDLLRLLSERPQWRADLRRAILPDDFQSLPDAVRELAEAQRRTEAELAQFGRRTEERFGRLEDAIARLVDAQQRTEAGLARLEQRTDERLGRLEEATRLLVEAQARTEDQLVALRADVAKDRGVTLEWRYREKAPGYFASMLRRARSISTADLDDMLEGALPDEERLDAVLLDLVIRGRLRGTGETPEVLLAVEVSATLDDGDVTRAARRATLLRKAGQSAVPVVAGEGATREGRIEAGVRHVAIVRDGTTELWDEALAAWPPLS